MSLTIALDAMGGDFAPEVVVVGAELARERHPELRFLLFGERDVVAPLLDAHPKLAAVAALEHTPDRVGADERPSQALRQGRNTSMWLAIQAVKEERAAAAVSAGNTGALMAFAKFILRTLPGIERPAIASMMPTRRSETVFLDLGANAECDAENLVQFAVMGEVFARTVLGVPKPTVGLLNIGTEEGKGHETIRNAAQMLRASGLQIEFRGFVEGTDLTSGTVDVVVTDGFTGNVALKVAEGMVSLYSKFLKDAFRSSLLSRLGYLLSRPALELLRQRVDPRRYNGAMFLGLNGIVVKSHGGTDAVGFANAIGVAVDLVQQKTNERITADLTRLKRDDASDQQARAS